MATYSKGSLSLANQLSVPAATPTASTTLSAASLFSIGIAGTITNGATAPTTGCAVQLQGSIDGGTTWYTIDQVVGMLGASIVTPFAFSMIPDGWAQLRLYMSGNTGQSVTVSAVAAYGASFS